MVRFERHSETKGQIDGHRSGLASDAMPIPHMATLRV